jgi:hypothetical protein
MKCFYRFCDKKSKEKIERYDEKIFCEHHYELFLDLYKQYKNTKNKEEELCIRQMVGFLYPDVFDYEHKKIAKIKQCKYCNKIDYISFNLYEDFYIYNFVCKYCNKERDNIEKLYYGKTFGWNATGYIDYDKYKKCFFYKPFLD